MSASVHTSAYVRGESYDVKWSVTEAWSYVKRRIMSSRNFDIFSIGDSSSIRKLMNWVGNEWSLLGNWLAQEKREFFISSLWLASTKLEETDSFKDEFCMILTINWITKLLRAGVSRNIQVKRCLELDPQLIHVSFLFFGRGVD